MGFAAVLLTCVTPVYHWLRPEAFASMQSISSFNGMSWFVGYYFLVMLCAALFLNDWLAKLDHKRYLEFLIVSFAILSFGWSASLVDNLAPGLRTLMTGVFLYALGGFLRRYDPLGKVRAGALVLVMALTYALIWQSAYNARMTSIEAYLRSGSTDPFIQTIPGYDNHSLVVIVLAVCLFELFTRLRLPESRGITFFGRATFMVYLVHDNGFFYELWNMRDWVSTLAQSPVFFVLCVLKWVAYTFAAGVAAYALFLLVLWLAGRVRRRALKEVA